MALTAAASAARGFAYSVRGGLYLSLTNECSSASLIETRGPGFSMSKSSGFAMLDEGVEPTGQCQLQCQRQHRRPPPPPHLPTVAHPLRSSTETYRMD